MFHSLWTFFWLCYYVIKHCITMKGGTQFSYCCLWKKEAENWRRCLKRLCFGNLVSKSHDFLSAIEKGPLFSCYLKCLSYFPCTGKGPFRWSRSLLPPSWIAEDFDENVNIKKYKPLNLNYVCLVGLAATFTACIFQSCKKHYFKNTRKRENQWHWSRFQKSYIALSDIENKISKGIKIWHFKPKPYLSGVKIWR